MTARVRAPGASAGAASRVSFRQGNPPTGIGAVRSSSQTSCSGPVASLPPYRVSFRYSLNAIAEPERGVGFVPAVGTTFQVIWVCATVPAVALVHGGVAGGVLLQTTEIVPLQRSFCSPEVPAGPFARVPPNM